MLQQVAKNMWFNIFHITIGNNICQTLYGNNICHKTNTYEAITSVMNHGNNISQKFSNNICLMSTIIHDGLNIYHLWQYHQPFTHILWVNIFSHTPSGVTKFAGGTFSSDLRKLTAVSESLSKFKIIYSVIEKIISYI